MGGWQNPIHSLAGMGKACSAAWHAPHLPVVLAFAPCLAATRVELDNRLPRRRLHRKNLRKNLRKKESQACSALPK